MSELWKRFREQTGDGIRQRSAFTCVMSDHHRNLRFQRTVWRRQFDSRNAPRVVSGMRWIRSVEAVRTGRILSTAIAEGGQKLILCGALKSASWLSPIRRTAWYAFLNGRNMGRDSAAVFVSGMRDPEPHNVPGGIDLRRLPEKGPDHSAQFTAGTRIELPRPAGRPDLGDRNLPAPACGQQQSKRQNEWKNFLMHGRSGE
jgi:hypothetical protein